MSISDSSTQRKKIPKHVKDLVWKKYMQDKPSGLCYCCEMETISYRNFEVGHNIAKAKGGTDKIDNLRPICRGCNSSMGTKSIESFKEKHFSSYEKQTTLKKNQSIKAVKSSENNVEAKAKLEIKVRKAISAADFQILSGKFGLDLCAKKSAFLESDQYLAYGFNLDDVVSVKYVRDFLIKIEKFYEKIKSPYFLGLSRESIHGRIAYIGELPKEVAELVKDAELEVEFRKY